MNNNSKISVVMLNYNGLKYLKKTIKPILDFDYTNYEFIIVDNGSTDGSIEYIKKFKDIILIESPKIREKNFAINYATKIATGDYLLILDNDCLIDDVYLLEDLINIYKSNDSCGILSLSFFDFNTLKSKLYGGYFSRLSFYKNIKTVDKDLFVKFDNQEVGFPHGQGFFIKKTIWKEIGEFDDYLIFGGDDNDIGIRSWLFGYKNYIYTKSFQIHLGLPERQDNKKYAIKFRDMFYAGLYTIVKNFKFHNMVFTLVSYSIFMLIKSIKQSIYRLDIRVIVSFFIGYCTFLKNLPMAIEKRKEIQSKRVAKEDIFLKIKPLKIK